MCSYAKTVTILSIDGGGIRGIIPAIVIKEIERRLSLENGVKPITHYFDIMAGTSAGGLITLLLNTPDEHGNPKYTTDDVIEFYEHLGSKVFKRSLWHYIMSLNGIVGSKYNELAFEDMLHTYFKDSTLKDTIKPVIVPAFDLSIQKMIFFRTELAKHKGIRNYYLRDVARSTTAAPTYFNPARVYNVDKRIRNIFVDGGVAVNNPTLCATLHAYDLYGKDIEIVVVSIGTGSIVNSQKSILLKKNINLYNMGFIDWSKLIIPLMMDSVNEVTDYQMQHLNRHQYFRLQIEMNPDNADIDNVSPDNLRKLKIYANELIIKNNDYINKVVIILNNLGKNIETRQEAIPIRKKTTARLLSSI